MKNVVYVVQSVSDSRERVFTVAFSRSVTEARAGLDAGEQLVALHAVPLSDAQEVQLDALLALDTVADHPHFLDFVAHMFSYGFEAGHAQKQLNIHV